MFLFLNYTFGLFNIIFSLAIYVAISYSLYSIGKRNNVSNSWLAFVPIVQYYIIGSICEEYIIFDIKIPKLKYTMILLAFLQTLLSIMGGFSVWVLDILLNIIIALIMHKFYYLFDPRSATLYGVLTLLGKIPMAIILYLIKDKSILMSAGAFPYPFEHRP